MRPKVKPQSCEKDPHLQTLGSALPAVCLRALGSLAECHLQAEERKGEKILIRFQQVSALLF